MIKNKENLFDSSLESGFYLLTCVPLEKYYVGESCYVTQRINAHKYALRVGIHVNRKMQEDFDNHSENTFIFQKLYFGVCIPKEEREHFENFILSTLPENNRYNFYDNWQKRSSILNPFYGQKHSVKAKKTLSKKGRPSPRQQSDDIKRRVSEENKGKKIQKKALYIDSVYYESIAEASENTGISRRLIRERCHSFKEQFQNYRWALNNTKCIDSEEKNQKS